LNATYTQARKQEAQAHITVANLTMAYGDFVIQHDLDFSVNRGDIFIIMGGSGCGKTTLLKNMIGLIEPASGDVYFDGDNYWKSNPDIQRQIKQRFLNDACRKYCTAPERVH
jgi:phospholipid/cholesterol/gamma-HCH transport system ATP-binding protein